MLLLLFACHHSSDALQAQEAAARPVLPSPEASVYGSQSAVARDPVVRAAVGDWPWDEALSGAAGALALNGGSDLNLPSARWVVWRAGYPYPVRTLLSVVAEAGALPNELLGALKTQRRPGDQIGLARARVGSVDRWVALLGSTPLPVAEFPRQVAEGEALSLSAAAPGTWSLASPTGQVSGGALPGAPVLNEAGEWWLEIRAAGGDLAVSAPVYAAFAPPADPPVAIPGVAPEDPEDALAEAFELVATLRAQFELPVANPDPTLDLVTREPLATAGTAAWDAGAVAHRIASTGFQHGGAATACKAATVPLCLDSVMRSVEGRAALLPPDYQFVGGSAQVSTDGVSLVLALAAE